MSLKQMTWKLAVLHFLRIHGGSDPKSFSWICKNILPHVVGAVDTQNVLPCNSLNQVLHSLVVEGLIEKPETAMFRFIGMGDYEVRERGSIGEKTVSRILEGLGIPFAREKKFSTCRGVSGRRYRFDFYCCLSSNWSANEVKKGVPVNLTNRQMNTSPAKIYVLIEFHGIQHFKPVPFFGGESTFKKVKSRDKEKEEWARANNIPLLVIKNLKSARKKIEMFFASTIKKYCAT